MHDDTGNQHQGRPSVEQQRQTDGRNREILGKIGTPSNQAGRQQHQHTGGHQPKHAFLAAVVFAGITHLMAVQHFRYRFHPFHIFFVDEVIPPITEKLHHKTDKHNQADKGVDDARQLRRAKHTGQPEKGGIEKRQAGNRQQHEANRHHPVVDALGARISLNQTLFHYASSSRFKISPSLPITSASSSSARFGPTVT